MLQRVGLVVGAVLLLLAGCGDDGRTEARAPTTSSTVDLMAFCRQHRPAAAKQTDDVGSAGGMGTATEVVRLSRDAGIDPAPWDSVEPDTPVYSCFYGFLPGTDPDVPLDQIPTTTSICPDGQVAIGYVSSGDPSWLVDGFGHSSVDHLGDAPIDDDPASSPGCDPAVDDGYGAPACVRHGEAAVCARLGAQDLEITATGLQPGSRLTVTPEGFDEAIQQPVGTNGSLTEPVYAAGGPLDSDPPPRSASVMGTSKDGARIEGSLRPSS